jgi:hypothetical protein
MATLSSIITPTNVVTTTPGASGNVLTSNGTAWISQAPSTGGGPVGSVLYLNNVYGGF